MPSTGATENVPRSAIGRKRVLVVHDSLMGWGTEKNLTHFGEYADRDRFAVSYLLTTARPASAGDGPSASQMFFLGVPRLRPNSYTQPLYFLLKFFYALAWFLRNGRRFDYLIASNAEECAIAFLVIKALRLRCKLIVYNQIPLDLGPANLFQNAVLRACIAVAKRADAVICLSRGLCDHLSATHKVKSRMYVLPSCIDLSRVDALSKETVDEAWLLQDRRKTIAYVGRLSNRQKRVDVLLEAIALLRRSHGADSFKAVLIGDGDDRGMLEQLAKTLGLDGQVYFLGYRSNPYKYCVRADLFVLSSDVEGFGNVIVEAMACGLPVIATDCRTGPGEILEGGKWGVLVPTGNHALLAEQILVVLTDEKLRLDLRRRSLARARDFECAKVFERFTQICEDIDQAGNAMGFT